MKKIISWNVASVKARMATLKTLLTQENPDIVFLQEIKTEEEKFPYLELKSLGYNSIVCGQKAWNGVAVLSKEPVNFVSSALNGFSDQARFIDVLLSDDTHLISVYVPNGQAPAKEPEDTSRLEYKLRWMDELHKYLSTLDRYIIGGDFNVIYTDNDVYNSESFLNSALMLPSVKDAFSKILSLPLENPLRDFHLNEKFYTFWDFQGGAWHKNNGIFLDYIFLSKPYFSGKVIQADVLKKYRSCEKPSDHAPVFVEVQF